MAQRVDVQYIQYYTPDSTARRVMPTTTPVLHPAHLPPDRRLLSP